MTEYIISFSVNGLHDVIPQKGDGLQVGKVLFHYREDERVASVNVISKNEKEAEMSALQEIDRSLGKICFGYCTEALIEKNGFYLVDVATSPSIEKVVMSLSLRSGYVAQDPKDTLKQIESIKDNKKDLLELALAYYRLGYKDNPLRLECFFSCLTVLIRVISGNDNVPTSTLKNGLKSILSKNDSKFDKNMFEDEWKKCYAEERCSIAHGRGSKLIDVGNPVEHERIVNRVHSWTRSVIYDFITSNQKP